jgi:hypothetical protein
MCNARFRRKGDILDRYWTDPEPEPRLVTHVLVFPCKSIVGRRWEGMTMLEL